MPLALPSRTLKAAALVGSGFASIVRTRRARETTIMTFHGLCEGSGDMGILDWSLHLPVEVFRSVCALLAAEYHVIPMSYFIEARSKKKTLPANSVVLTFDDGFESNFKLAYPILKRFNLPATIYATTGFLDGTDVLWFQRIDLAFGRTRKESLTWKINDRKLRLPLKTRKERQDSLVELMPELKMLPDADLLGEVNRLERALCVDPPRLNDLPASMRPLTWADANQMISEGLIEIGGHTHTHPILSRCESFSMKAEITTCRDRILAETGVAPVSFAYPNGGEDDYAHETVKMVKSAGFKSACTTMSGRVDAGSSLFQLPRYGSPESIWEAEATVSGAFETLKEWRQSCLKAMSMI
ncbi:MAG: polysaccharide deacetylase family protein [Prosthecobacter sp.]